MSDVFVSLALPKTERQYGISERAKALTELVEAAQYGSGDAMGQSKEDIVFFRGPTRESPM